MAAKRTMQLQNTPVVDTGSLNAALSTQVNVLETQRKHVADLYKAEKKVTVTGSPMYRPYFGNNMAVVVNGIAVYVPLDGQPYEIPETFAAVFVDRIARVDEQINMRKRMAAISSNSEAYAGEKELIRRA